MIMDAENQSVNDDGHISDEIKDENVEEGNQGMAAVMAKILNRGTNSSTTTASSAPPSHSVIMSKAITEKQSAARKRKHLDNGTQDDGIEEVNEDGDVKTDSGEPSVRKSKLRKQRSTVNSIKLKQEREEMCHVKPDALDRNRELNLLKIATRGVVQLFNAVKQQQSNIRKKVDQVKKSVRKTDKEMSKFTSGDFLDRLKSQKVKTSTNNTNNQSTTKCEHTKQEVKDEPCWDALRDDYMMTSQTLKDWDKLEGEEASAAVGIGSAADNTD